MRERKEDIPALIQYFLEHFSKETKKRFDTVAEEAQEKLSAYDWPGNVRELANVIERAVVLGEGPKVTLESLPERVVSLTSPSNPNLDNLPYSAAIDAYRRDMILKALAQSKGNRTAAAKKLGLHEKSLLRLIKSLRIP